MFSFSFRTQVAHTFKNRFLCLLWSLLVFKSCFSCLDVFEECRSGMLWNALSREIIFIETY